MRLEDFAKSENVNWKALKKAIRDHAVNLVKPQYARYAEAALAAKKLSTTLRKRHGKLDFRTDDGVLRLGSNAVPTPQEKKDLRRIFELMRPWRKGPFEICGELLDAEWRSDKKWERVKKAVGPLQGRKILDIGCNNGYYLYLMSRQKPRFVLGIDPVVPYFRQFEAIRHFHDPDNVDFGLFGVDELVHFEKVFDVVFCMGILYHHADPIGILKKIYRVLRPGGLLIVESQGVPTSGSYFLFPQNRYAGMPGHWFLPTREALENLLRRSGLQYVETFFETRLTADEQRPSKESPFASLADGLDPTDKNLTIEGYPAPWRFYVKARRARIR